MSALRLVVSCVIVSVALGAVGAFAHHSFAAEYDADQPITLSGEVLQVDLVNPHAWLYIETTNESGERVRWNVEMSSPNALIRQGITKDTVTAGTSVTIEGYRAKDGSNTINSRTITLANGEPLFSGSRDTGAPE